MYRTRFREILWQDEKPNVEKAMTQEEIARFALMLKGADLVRAMIAEDEAAERAEEVAQEEAPLGMAA